jgi:uncharacterized membrane protein HdeD (DUF308 family)
MTQKFSRNWPLVLAGVLQAAFAILNLLMRDPEAVTLRRVMTESTTMLQAQLALAAGLCTLAAAIWSYRKSRSWLLALDGLALIVYGTLPVIWSDRPLSFRPLFALLLLVMAMSVGTLALESARRVRGYVAQRGVLGFAGTATIAFALAFVALDLRGIGMMPPRSFFLLLGSFFASCAVCLLGVSLLPNGQRPAIPGVPAALGTV